MGKKNGNNAVSMFDMQFVTATISTTLVLLLLGMVLFFVLTARNLSVYVRENINFSLVLDDGMDNRTILRLQRSLEKQPFVKEMTYISKEDALKDYIREMGIDPRKFAGFNPLSASIEIRLKSAYANTDSIERIEKQLGQETHIKDIIYQQEHRTHQPPVAGTGRLAVADFLCVDQQYHQAHHLRQAVPDTHHAIGRGRLGIHPAAFPVAQLLDWLVCGLGGRCRTMGLGWLVGDHRARPGKRGDSRGNALYR